MTKILLADDSITIQKVVELTFSDGKSQVTAVSDGTAALEKIRQDRPDIILSDVNMPGINGYELCQKVKSDPHLGTIPFLFLKGTFESFDEEKARQCGSDGYIVKPFESQDLIRKVQELLTAAPPAPAAPPVPEAAPAPPAPSPAEAPPSQPPAAAAAPAGAPDDAIFDLSDELTTSEPAREILGEGPPPAEASEEEDLWSEVSLRDSSSPLVEDKVLEDESFWGTAGGAGMGDEGGGGPSGEDLLEEVGEPEVLDLTEDAGEPPFPPVHEDTVTPVEEEPAPLFPEPEPAPEEVRELETGTPAEPGTPAVSPAAAEPRASGGPSAVDLEQVVSAKLEEAVRSVLAPVIGDAARRIVEEVAWEVIPDLAEAMIKSEIERIRKQGGA